MVQFEVSGFRQFGPYLEKKAFIPIYNIHSYLQRSQIYNHFLKAFFCCCFCFVGFPNKDGEFYKNEMQEELSSEGLYLEPATVTRENRTTKTPLLGNALPLWAVDQSICPVTALYTHFSSDPFQFNDSNMCEEMCKRRLFSMPSMLGQGIRKESTDLVSGQLVQASAVSRPILRAPLMLQVIVTVLANSYWRGDFQAFDFRLKAAALLAEKLATVPAVMSPFRE